MFDTISRQKVNAKIPTMVRYQCHYWLLMANYMTAEMIQKVLARYQIALNCDQYSSEGSKDVNNSEATINNT